MDSGTVENHADTIDFPHFDVVPVATDHRYFPSKPSVAVKHLHQDTSSSVYLKIMKEWKILKGKNNLPDSIYVQAYESRIDLLRAVIIGSPGTPYHDGLFFFDICLPPDYPNQPPKVHYISHGYYLNPNLYGNGKVCLSLINTWRGENWTPTSTILQTLVSIQGLVLNERPYFNEPGYEVGKNSECPIIVNSSIDYSQKVFIFSCKSMVHIMLKPPKNFEDFVVWHFRARSGSILAAVRGYETGRALVGKFDQTSQVKDMVDVSHRFKNDLKKVRSGLVTVFTPYISEAIINMDDVDVDDDHDISEAIINMDVDDVDVDDDHDVKAKENVKKHKKDVDVDVDVDDVDVDHGVKAKENVKKHKKGVLSKLLGFAKCIWK